MLFSKLNLGVITALPLTGRPSANLNWSINLQNGGKQTVTNAQRQILSETLNKFSMAPLKITPQLPVSTSKQITTSKIGSFPKSLFTL